MTDIAGALERTGHALAAAGIPNPRREARLLLCLAAGISLENSLANTHAPLDRAVEARLCELTERRAGGEPMARLRGHQEFWSLTFTLGPETLIPRPDSETLVAAALALLPVDAPAIELLDLGCGSGCLLLAVLSERPGARGTGVDISEGACAVAAANATKLGLAARADFTTADWHALPSSVAGRAYDMILCNPPYVCDGEIAGLAPEVARFEPHRALAGGHDGLDAYRTVAPITAGLLKPGGALLLELGAGQAEAVACIVEGAGLTIAGLHADLSGTPRCLLAKAD